MIVWNADRRFYPTKAQADAYCKDRGWPPSTVIKVNIRDREMLAAFLTALCMQEKILARAVTGERRIIAADVPESTDVPKFLGDSRAKHGVPT